jgi:hypothetical protein
MQMGMDLTLSEWQLLGAVVRDKLEREQTRFLEACKAKLTDADLEQFRDRVDDVAGLVERLDEVMGEALHESISDKGSLVGARLVK